MRLSCRKDDPGEAEYDRLNREGKCINIYLNGKDCTKFCRTADTDEGFIIVTKTDKNEKILQHDDGSIIEETLHGNVEIIID